MAESCLLCLEAGSATQFLGSRGMEPALFKGWSCLALLRLELPCSFTYLLLLLPRLLLLLLFLPCSRSCACSCSCACFCSCSYSRGSARLNQKESGPPSGARSVARRRCRTASSRSPSLCSGRPRLAGPLLPVCARFPDPGGFARRARTKAAPGCRWTLRQRRCRGSSAPIVHEPLRAN